MPSTASLWLQDGREVRVRPVRADDAKELQEAFALLSEASRFQRFHTGTPALSDRAARYLADIDHTNHEALVAISQPFGKVVGVARFIRVTACPTEAELAITVADDWQRAGLARSLLRLLSDRACAEGVENFTVEMLADNPAVLALVRAAGGAVGRARDGVVLGRIPLPAAHRRAGREPFVDHHPPDSARRRLKT